MSTGSFFESKNVFGFSAADFLSWLFEPENFPGVSRNGAPGQSHNGCNGFVGWVSLGAILGDPLT